MKLGMATLIAPGLWQIGIYEVVKIGRGQWESRAVGPGTVGDGSPHRHTSLRAAHRFLTGEDYR